MLAIEIYGGYETIFGIMVWGKTKCLLRILSSGLCTSENGQHKIYFTSVYK